MKINDKKRILILLKILGQIQQDNKDARNDTEKSISVICKEEGISFEQVFYILFFFDAVFISNRSSFNFKSRKFILGQPITLCLQLYVMTCNSSLAVWRAVPNNIL